MSARAWHDAVDTYLLPLQLVQLSNSSHAMLARVPRVVVGREMMYLLSGSAIKEAVLNKDRILPRK